MIKDLSRVELLVDLLKTKVGAPLSINSIREDLEVSFNTVARWIEVLEAVYFCYRIYPISSPKYRAVKHTAKLYLWDWAQVESPGARFENLVASHLLKFCHFLEDTQGDRMELRYIRDVYNKEVDFVVLKNKKALFAVECKTGEKHVSPALKSFLEKGVFPKAYQVHLGTQDYLEGKDGKIRILPFKLFCELENIP